MSSAKTAVPGGNCRICGGESKVFDSRTPVGCVRRRRECLACGRRWSTSETEIIEGEEPKHTVTLEVHSASPIVVEVKKPDSA